MSWTHEHSWKVEAAPARVFRACLDPTELQAWFAEHAEVVADADGSYRFWGKHTLGTPTAAEADQRIVRIEPDRRLVFGWTVHGVPSEVTMAFAAEGEATRVTLHHRVDGELPLPRPKALIDDFWRFSLGNLMQHVTGGPISRPDFADPSPEVRLAVRIEAPPEAVWRALVEPESINRWMGSSTAVVEPREGGAYKVGWKYQVDGVDVEGGPTRILAWDPPRHLALDWPDWRGDAAVPVQRIAFYLEARDGGTEVTLVHSGFTRAADISDYPFGWVWFLGQLGEEVRRLSAG